MFCSLFYMFGLHVFRTYTLSFMFLRNSEPELLRRTGEILSLVRLCNKKDKFINLSFLLQHSVSTSPLQLDLNVSRSSSRVATSRHDFRLQIHSAIFRKTMTHIWRDISCNFFLSFLQITKWAQSFVLVIKVVPCNVWGNLDSVHFLQLKSSYFKKKRAR